MFVLQDCSICLEDYDGARTPHNLPCGHVFCRPCLDSLMYSSPRCPHCRSPFNRNVIRKVVCALQDPPAASSSIPSEAERMMWQAISASVKSMEEPDQRMMLVQNNSRLAVREAGYSENLLVALDVMQLLVDIENIYRGLNRTMETARIFEESMQARIAFLETRLDGAREKSSSRDFQTLLSEIRDIKSSMYSIHENSASQTSLPSHSISGATRPDKKSKSLPPTPEKQPSGASLENSTLVQPKIPPTAAATRLLYILNTPRIPGSSAPGPSAQLESGLMPQSSPAQSQTPSSHGPRLNRRAARALARQNLGLSSSRARLPPPRGSPLFEQSQPPAAMQLKTTSRSLSTLERALRSYPNRLI